jgi:hypothetical protein
MNPGIRPLPDTEMPHSGVIKWEFFLSVKIGVFESDCGTITLRDFFLPDFDAPKPVSSILAIEMR